MLCCCSCAVQAVPYLTWLLPCIMIIALVACAAVLLELRYQKLIRTGAYNPKTCTLSNAGPSIPLARVRTHRCVLAACGCCVRAALKEPHCRSGTQRDVNTSCNPVMS